MVAIHRALQNSHLLKSAKKGSLRGVKIALALGADVKAKSRNGWTAIMYAYSNYHPEIVSLLKKKGAKMTQEETVNAQIGASLHKACEDLPAHHPAHHGHRHHAMHA